MFEKAIALDSGNPQGYGQFGKVEVQRNERRKAYYQFLRCMELDTNYANAYTNMRLLLSISKWINNNETFTTHPRFMIVQLMQFINRRE